MLGLKLNHVSKRGHRKQIITWVNVNPSSTGAIYGYNLHSEWQNSGDGTSGVSLSTNSKSAIRLHSYYDSHCNLRYSLPQLIFATLYRVTISQHNWITRVVAKIRCVLNGWLLNKAVRYWLVSQNRWCYSKLWMSVPWQTCAVNVNDAILSCITKSVGEKLQSFNIISKVKVSTILVLHYSK